MHDSWKAYVVEFLSRNITLRSGARLDRDCSEVLATPPNGLGNAVSYKQVKLIFDEWKFQYPFLSPDILQPWRRITNIPKIGFSVRFFHWGTPLLVYDGGLPS